MRRQTHALETVSVFESNRVLLRYYHNIAIFVRKYSSKWHLSMLMERTRTHGKYKYISNPPPVVVPRVMENVRTTYSVSASKIVGAFRFPRAYQNNPHCEKQNASHETSINRLVSYAPEQCFSSLHLSLLMEAIFKQKGGGNTSYFGVCVLATVLPSRSFIST